MKHNLLSNEVQAQAFVARLAGEDGNAIARLEWFATALLEENRNQNLISRSSESSLWLRHIADSAQLLCHVPRETSMSEEVGGLKLRTWLDLGTGAGFPGLVIAALAPEFEVVLVESRKRRAEWLSYCIEQMKLANCRVEASRIESLSLFPAGVISARAFAPLDQLLRLAARFSTAQTIYLLPKGRSAEQEWQNLPSRRRRLFHVEQSLTDPMAQIILSAPRGGKAREQGSC